MDRIKESLPPTKRYSIFPKSLAKSVEPLLKPIYKKHGFAEHRILTEWQKIVGQELANYSIPQKLVTPRQSHDGGTLHIIVASARALELQHMQPVIMDNIAAYFGYKAVTRIKLTQTSADIFRKTQPKQQQKKMPPSKEIIESAAQCSDDDLRNALLSLGSFVKHGNK